MKLLEVLYAQDLKQSKLYPRKVSITDDKTMLVGPKRSGKTSIILDHLSREKKGDYLYIDFSDLRVNQAIFIGLPNFLKKHNISLLVLDNFDFSFKIPPINRVIISTHQPKKLDLFRKKELYPLDFEEFIAFEKRQFQIESIFNDYAICGTYPAMATIQKDRLIKEFQNLIISMMDSELELLIFKSFALSQGQIMSPFALFNELKIFHKISKDKFYTTIKKLQDEKMIFLVEKFKKPKADKKVYLVDFAIKSVLTFDKDFIKRFENIIFLELLKSNEEVYFTDMIEFYLPKKDLAIIPILFAPKQMIKNKIERIKKDLLTYDIKKLQILTLEEEGEFEIDGIKCQISTFWEWALGR
jgi:hypothetical protein